MVMILIVILNCCLIVDLILQEQGDLKLRVRALESERAFQRVAAVQKTIGSVSLARLGCYLFLQVPLFLGTIKKTLVLAYSYITTFSSIVEHIIWYTIS